MKLRGSVVFITGAAKRIGRAIALHLAERGAELIVHYHRSQSEARFLQKEIFQKYRSRVHLIRGDLAKLSGVRRIAQQAWETKGQIDVLINNASSFYPTPLGRVRADQWEVLVNVNAGAPFFLSEWIGLKMKRRGQGKIVNISDWVVASPAERFIPYAAGKAALIAVSQGMARALAPEVQVNTILPGAILWPEMKMSARAKAAILKRILLKRHGDPEDIAQTVRFFIEGSDYITGSLLHVDGGRNIE